jgi:hypothetical protein
MIRTVRPLVAVAMTGALALTGAGAAGRALPMAGRPRRLRPAASRPPRPPTRRRRRRRAQPQPEQGQSAPDDPGLAGSGQQPASVPADVGPYLGAATGADMLDAAPHTGLSSP